MHIYYRLIIHLHRHLDSGLMMQFASFAGQGLEKLRIPPELLAACPTKPDTLSKSDR